VTALADTEPRRAAGGSSRWSLRRRIGSAMLALVVVLTALLAGAVVLLIQLRNEQRTVIDRYFTAVSITNTRLADQLDAETAVRGYALTGETSFLQPLATYRSTKYAAEGRRIEALTQGDPTVVAAFQTWDRATVTWYDQWAVPSIATVGAHGKGSLSPTEVGAGKTLFDANRRAESRFFAVLVAKRNSASSALRLRTDLLFGAVAVIVFVFLVASGLLWWALRRWVVGPLADVGAQVRDVRAGELGRELRVTRAPPEVSDLAADVDDMRQTLVAQLDEVEQARQEIEAARQRLERQAEELSRSNRDLEQFAYVASHDLQEPLRKVASFCQLLERRYSDQLDERGLQYIAFAVDGAKRMQQLINDLLAFSRIGRSGQFAEVDLNRCLDSALANLSTAIESTQAEITSSDLPVVRGQAGPLTQLFQNLIGNALKFQAGESPRVRIDARRTADGWELACADNGLGIEPQYAERIFVLFQRLHGKEEYAGTGIGLALCKRIVELHGGQIWLDTSSAAPGTTFRWTLPDVHSTETDQQATVQSEESS
jgi:signal transduction histidine kinase